MDDKKDSTEELEKKNTPPKGYPSLDEVKKEFEGLIKDKFGPHVNVITQMGPDLGKNSEEEVFEGDQAKKSKSDPIDEFSYRPKDIKSYLDQFVIKQDEAKKVLSVAVCDHYNHIKATRHQAESEINYSKQNVLLLGPTGVGKTYLVKLVAQLLGVPFVKADATKYTEAGYVGSNVEDMIKDLYRQSGQNKELSQYGIIYIDEGDKLAAPSNLHGKDVGGKGVQFSLLKLMEESEIDLTSGNDISSQLHAFMDFQKKGKVGGNVISTKNILFIISGAFTGLEDIIKKRLNQNSIGFHKPKSDFQEGEWLKETTTQDLIKFGFEPEFTGRLPVRVACENLGQSDLVEILDTAKHSIIDQYKSAFEAYGIKLSFTRGGIEKIAELAAQEKTGARGLMSVLERTLRDYKYELPDLISELIVDEKLVVDPKTVLEKKIFEHYNSLQ